MNPLYTLSLTVLPSSDFLTKTAGRYVYIVVSIHGVSFHSETGTARIWTRASQTATACVLPRNYTLAPEGDDRIKVME